MKLLLQAIVSLLLCTAPPVLAAPPDKVQATYDVYKSGLGVEISETYTRDKDRYTLTSVWKPLGLLALLKPEKIFIDSNGLVGKRGLQPLLLTHRRELDKRKDSRAEFDWGNKQLTLIHDAQRKVVALPDGTQDRLSAMYQFMFMNLQEADTIDFPMTNGSKLDDYRYAVTHNQTITVPAGKFDVIYLESQSKTGESRTRIWLARQHHNLPCKIIVTEANGDQFTQVLTKINFSP